MTERRAGKATTAPIDIRERRRAAVADEIERVAMELFVRHGLGEVTVDEIAEAAGISPRTFFRYFPSKGDLVRAHQRRLGDRLVRLLAARPAAEGPVTALRNALLATAQMRPEDRDRVVMIGRILAETPLGSMELADEASRRNELVRLVGARLSSGSSRFAPAVVVAAMLAAAQTAFWSWVGDDSRDSLDKTMAEALDLVETGLSQLDRGSPRRRRGA